MPETSQDAFEALYPLKQPISAEELRLRPSSMNKNFINFEADALSADSWVPSLKARPPRVSRVSATDLDSCITVPDNIYSYKRESSHR